ncbi:MAG: LON peptidase substrate-binding domain-containing protein [Chloracidobacterium sp.]|nr:LON peptidase substrate-binding domain-containing protein [Chloracidobacterium sp.]
MSEILEKFSGIKHLPIFPLPLVMVPGELVPLHIFEERYRKMLRDVEAGDGFFGLSFFEPSDDLLEAPAAGSVGCVAELRESELMPDGRSNILTLGIVRYRLIDLIDAGEPYLVGDLEFFEDETESESELEMIADEVFALFERMAKAAFKMSGGRGDAPEILRTNPEALSFLITAALNFDNEKKYDLLKMPSTIERLAVLKTVLTRAVTPMEESAEIHIVSHTNGHSKKKLDL